MIRFSVKKTAAGIMLLSIFLVFGCHRGWEDKTEVIVEEITDHLDLDETQQEHLRVIVSRLAGKAKSFHDEKSDMMNDFIEELRSDSINEVRLNRVMDEKKAQIEELTQLFITGLSEFHAVLTVEQREKLATHLEKMRDRRKRWCGMRQPLITLNSYHR